jgi:3-hydroxybutyryl-CoA dehydrogenase
VETRVALRRASVRPFEALAECAEAGQACGQIQTQILLAVINEAGHALDERVASPQDIDLAMKKGTNYPRGPIEWAAGLGRRAVQEKLTALDALLPGRFTPARHWRV